MSAASCCAPVEEGLLSTNPFSTPWMSRVISSPYRLIGVTELNVQHRQLAEGPEGGLLHVNR